MSEHVDYWNSLGWKDPFSASQFTNRQNEYAKAFGGSDVYTPQMVVDGRTEFIGNDRSQAIEAVTRSSRIPKSAITINCIPVDGESVKVQVQLTSLPGGPADVYLAVTENNLLSNVTRGENVGHKLAHVAVVRKLSVIGHSGSDSPFKAEPVVRLPRDWKRPDLGIIVFAQNTKTRNIVALSPIFPLRSQ